MDGLAKLLAACQLYQQGSLGDEQLRYEVNEALADCTSEELAAFTGLIVQYALHLREAH